MTLDYIYIYKIKKKKVGFNAGCLRYQTITNSTQNKIYESSAFGHVINLLNRLGSRVIN